MILMMIMIMICCHFPGADLHLARATQGRAGAQQGRGGHMIIFISELFIGEN